MPPFYIKTTFTTCDELVELFVSSIFRFNFLVIIDLEECTFDSTDYYSTVLYTANFTINDDLINKIINSYVMEITTSCEELVNKLLSNDLFYIVSKIRNGVKRWTLVRNTSL
jgi:hypothetical protein